VAGLAEHQEQTPIQGVGRAAFGELAEAIEGEHQCGRSERSGVQPEVGMFAPLSKPLSDAAG
jgi:hypothetical protein